MSEYLDIRSYQEGDEKQILELFSKSYFGRQMPLPYWRWRFRDNPSGPGVIQLAWERDMLASHYAVTSVAMRIGSQDCLTGLSGTTMTHPAFRGRRLFPILAGRTYQEMADCGMKMVWGFPNTMSHRGFNCDLGWHDIYEIPTFRLDLVSQKITSAVQLSHVCELFDTNDQFDLLWDKNRGDYDIIVRRDQSYIRWRYFSNPIEKYRLVCHVEKEQIQGYAVFKCYQDELQVVDLFIGKDGIEIGKSLMQFIIIKAIEYKLESVSLWLNVTHFFHYALERMGFKPEGPVTYLGALVLNSQFSSTLYDFRRWYFTMGDSDVF